MANVSLPRVPKIADYTSSVLRSAIDFTETHRELDALSRNAARREAEQRAATTETHELRLIRATMKRGEALTIVLIALAILSIVLSFVW